MTERVISIKMPTSLVHELDDLRAQNHYLDFSEQLRSVVRSKCLELTKPTSMLSRHAAKEEILHELISMLKEGEQ